MSTFQRARRPEQKDERTSQILAAAAALLQQEPDSTKLSLNALAKHAGMSKANIYRYFESREAVLIALLTQDWTTWSADFAAALEQLSAEGEPEAVLARCLSGTVSARPRLCHLTSVLPSVLERNLSEETVLRFKLQAAALMTTVAQRMRAFLPALSEAQHLELLQHAIVLMIALWPLSHPAPVVVEALRDPRIQHMAHAFERDLTRALTLFLRGLVAESAQRTAEPGQG